MLKERGRAAMSARDGPKDEDDDIKLTRERRRGHSGRGACQAWRGWQRLRGSNDGKLSLVHNLTRLLVEWVALEIRLRHGDRATREIEECSRRRNAEHVLQKKRQCRSEAHLEVHFLGLGPEWRLR
jgi:hypothetical protein